MEIVHISIEAPYNDYFGYQDNLLPKYHQKQGHNVTVITTNTKHQDSRIMEIDANDYWLSDGEHIIRLRPLSRKPTRIFSILHYFPYYGLLCEIKPDFIMVHGVDNISAMQVKKYINHVNPACIAVADNHLDYYNGSSYLRGKAKLLMYFYRGVNRIMQPCYAKVFGVTPWRIKYMQEVFGIKPEKSALLVMGGDDEKIDFVHQQLIRQDIRKKLSIDPNDFVIITGGKIDRAKNIHLLIEAVLKLVSSNVKLLVFGQPTDDMASIISDSSDSDRIRMLGWLPSDQVYPYFLSADLAVFPGTHSVLWEQACACGIPCVVKDWEGMHHVDVGGNCRFLQNDSAQEIQNVLEEIIEHPDIYSSMKEIAVTRGVLEFSYEAIAKKAIEMVKR